MKIGDKVIVSPEALGDGLYHAGVIECIEVFLHTTYVTINFVTPTSDGIDCVTLINLDLIKVVTDEHIKSIDQCL